MSNIKNRIILALALISILLIVDYSLLFFEQDLINSISSVENDVKSFITSNLKDVRNENPINVYSIQSHTESTKITGKSTNIRTGDSIYVSPESENPKIEKEGASSGFLTMGTNGTYIDIIGQTSSMNVTKNEFFNFSVSVRCKNSCSDVILTLDPYESVQMTKSELGYAKHELENIQNTIEKKNLGWQARMTEFYLEYMKRKMAGEEHPFAMAEPETPELAVILQPQAKNQLFQIKSAATGTRGKVLPYYMDWRNMYNEDWTTSVKSQRTCYGCWAFGAVAVTESSQMIYNKIPNINIDLAEQELISCGGGGDCSRGGGDYQALGYIMNNGIVSESCFPYTATNNNCNNRCNYTTKYFIKERISLVENPDIKREDAIQYLLKYGPASTQMWVYNDFPAYSSGIYEPGTTSHGGIHIITVLGYNETGDYFIIKNSWGSGWGMNGYGYIKSWVLLNDPLIWNRLYFANGTNKIMKGVIPMNSGTPFYTITQNPYNCGNLLSEQECNITWQINATGFHQSSWDFFVILNSGEENLTSENSTITIIGNYIPEIQNIECEVNSIWKECNETGLGNITRIRTNVTDFDNSISSVSIRLKEGGVIINEGTANLEEGFYIINASKKVLLNTNYTIEVDVFDDYWINGFVKWTSPSTCIEDWQAQYDSCTINDTQFKYYIDINSCGTNNNLPVDNGTYIFCDYCIPSWLEINTTCQIGDFKTGWFNDTNSCFFITNLSSDNNPPENNTYWCNYQNDPPVLDFIENITVFEGQIVQINPTANDADNDTLVFSFTPPLNSTGGWQTNIGDAGSYIVNVSVSDGNLTDSQIIEILVLVNTIPGSIKNLTMHSKDLNWIYWTWTNPPDTDFANNIVYLNGINVLNTTDNFYKAVNLQQNEIYTITIHTINSFGKINDTDILNTTRTCLEVCSFGKCYKFCT